MNLKTLLIILITWSNNGLFAQSKTIEELRSSDQVQFNIHFNASTLRMLNFQKDPGYDQLVRGVKKLSFYVMRPGKFSSEDYFTTMDKLMNQEQYEEYIIWENTEYELQVLGKAKEKEMVGLANYRDRFYLFNLKGTLDLTKLPELYQTITAADSTMNNGFSIILDMINSDEERRIRKEKREKEKAEKRKKEAEEREKIKQDSIANSKA